jgi:RND superfamily putative drug exporter
VAAARRVPQTVGGSQAFLGSVHVSADHTVAFADLHFTVPVAKITAQTKAALQRVADPARKAGLQVGFSGGVISTASGGGGASDLIGIIVAFIVLAITFSALLAAGLPLVTAALGVGLGLLGITAATGIVSLNSTAPTLALMLGLAVGIDYALFIVSRCRQNLEAGMPLSEAVPMAIGTAGSAVAFAGTTVVIALVGLSVVGIPFLSQMGIAAAATVVIAVLVALTLLPALIAFMGPRIATRRRSLPALTLGRRWALTVTRHPVAALLGVIVLGVVAASPVLGIRLGLPDGGTMPKNTTQRQAYDLLSKGFGAGFNGPLTVVVDATGKPNPVAIGKAAATGLGKFPGVAAASPAIPNSTGNISIIQVTPKNSPSSAATSHLVSQLRAGAAKVRQQYHISLYVTGTTALNIDISNKLGSALPLLIVLIVGLALLLLILVFRSLLVPLVAVLGFLLTIGATLGVITFVFQEGHGASLFGAAGAGIITSFLPVLLVAIVFGLAMDYEMFLVSRMHEAHAQGESAVDATVTGFSGSARVVTAAAVIMFSVFASFVTSEETVIKSIAFGLAVGVLFDAFLVRMTLIPAVHTLLGDRGWWLPRWLARILPNLDIEGERLAHRPR